MVEFEESNYAKEVYVFLDERYRVSRNFRLKWYLDHLFKQLPSCKDLNDSNDEHIGLQVVSVIPSKLQDSASSQSVDLILSTDTKVVFLSGAYKFVFGIDLSSSVLRVDTLEHYVVIESILTSLEKCLMSLLQNYSGKNFEIKPDIYVTIFAQWHGTEPEIGHSYDDKLIQKVLIQGCSLSLKSVKEIMLRVKDCIYACAYVNCGNKLHSKQDDILLSILRTSLLALRVLPPNRSSCIVIITDGVVGEPSAASLERVLKQCQSTTTACSFIHVCSSSNPLCDFGSISNIELMKFISQSTKGKYINSLLIPSTSFNLFFQEALLPWTLHSQQQLSSDKNALMNRSKKSCSAFDLRNLIEDSRESPALIRQKQDDRSVVTDFLTVVSARLREGFEIKSTTISKNTIEMCLELHWWKNCTVVEYKVSSAWPFSSNRCRIEVYICGTYEFLLDVSKSHESRHWTRYRKLIMHRFKIFFQDLMHSDHMLQYLQGFTNDQVRYSISDSLRQGQTLYYLPPNSSQFELSTQFQHTTNAFSSYWKPILSLDVTVWHKWFNIHRIEAILQHDIPLPSNLHAVSYNGRYHSVQCRKAVSLLASMLREWCTFVLLENHTYVKFIYEDSNSETPSSFFLVRLSSKSPAMILKLAFLGGLSGKARKHYVDELRDHVAALVVSVSGMSSTSTSSKRVRHTSAKLSPVMRSHRTPHSASEEPCAILLHKPMDQVLVRYSQPPEDYHANAIAFETKVKVSSDINDQYVRMRDMQWYLRHHRCVWSLTNTTLTQLSLHVACDLASLLQKIRMKEGFRITYSSSGVVNLAREFPMHSSNESDENITDYCLVQYVIFPPKMQSTNSINSSSSSEDDGLEDDVVGSKEIVCATEVWVEPQHGCVKPNNLLINSVSDLDHADTIADYQTNLLRDVTHYGGLSCDEIIQHINMQDYICISNVITLEHLQLMCTVENDMTACMFPQRQGQSVLNDMESIGTSVSSRDVHFTADNVSENDNSPPMNSGLYTKDLNYFSCVFDFVCLLDHSPRVTHLFMTLAEDESSPSLANTVLLDDYHKSLSMHCDCYVDLSDEDQITITKHMIEKSLKTEHLDKVDQSGAQNWSCYLKSGENGQIFVILLPASYKSFLRLAYLFEDKVTLDSQDTSSNAFYSSTLYDSNMKNYTDIQDVSDTPTETSHSDKNIGTTSPRGPRRMSIKRLASTGSNNSENFSKGNPSAVSLRTFSVFVYNCSMKMLVSSLLHGAKNTSRIKWPDSLQDHRLCVDCSNDDYFPPFSSQKQSNSFVKPSLSSHGLGDISDDAYSLHSPESKFFSHFNTTIRDHYYRSFVVGIFSAVQSEEKVFFSTDDLQIATDYFCRESIDEIDITDFMFLNSPQILEFKSKNSKPNLHTKIDIPEDINFSSDDANVADKGQHSNAPTKVRQVRRKKFISIGSSDVQIDHHYHKADMKNAENKDIFSQKNEEEDGSCGSTDSSSVRNGPTPTFPSISFHKDSAFTSVRGNQLPLKKKQIEASDKSTTSEEEADVYRSKHLSASADKKGTTLPIKQMIRNIQQVSGLQTGWNNLPEFSLSLLNVPHSRHFSGTNEQVEKHFLKFLKAHCQGVRGVPYLFYAVNKLSSPRRVVPETEIHKTDSDLEVQFISESENAVTQTISFNESEGTPAPLILPDLGVTSPTDYIDDRCSDIIENAGYINPLFLYMTCTIRDVKTGNVGTVPVRCLPINLKDVVDSLEVPSNSIELSNVKITLDLTWIHLPSNSESETIKNVPEECSAFVQDIKTKIKWLLEDEIISSLRTTEPINVSTLERVANHVKISSSSNTKVSSIPLQFIFGIDKSMALLHSEFEKFRIDNYKLKKVDHYYFLSLERTFLPIFDRFNSMEKVATIESMENEGESVQYLESDSPVIFQSHLSKLSAAKAMDSSQGSLSAKNKPVIEPNQSGTVPLQVMTSNIYQIEKHTRKLTKASSSNELVQGSNSAARRCTSASNMPFAITSVNEVNHSGSLGFVDKVVTHDVVTPPPVLSHQALRTSLSLGKEPKYSFPASSSKGRVVSMPVTPSSVANLTSEMFVFPLASYDSRQNIGISPISDSSIHQCSQPSWFGSGYEGEESDSEDELDFRSSLQEAYSQLPNFWLIVNFNNAFVTIYFHRRSSTRVLPAVKMEHARIFDLVTSNLRKSCRAVNQTLLLKQLHNSLWCHPLLVEESPEDIWKKDDYSSIYHHTDSMEDQMVHDVHKASYSNDYLAATMNFPPGHFECKCILEQCIILHHRITVSKPSSGGTVPSALSTVKSKMKNFTVINQKHMFVFQVQDGTIYYCKMREDIKRPDSSGRRSSLMLTDAEHSPQSKDLAQRNQENDSKLHLRWYGVHELSLQHEKELQELKVGIEKKLDDSVLEYITMMLCRHSQFKLTAADVRLIQPRVVTADGLLIPVSPDETVSFAVSSHLIACMPALLYYIHQHLLLFLSIPRYTGFDPVQFLPINSKHFSSGSARIDSPALYLYSESNEKGKKGHGVACICLDYSKREPRNESQPRPSKLDTNVTIDRLKELTTIRQTQVHAHTADTTDSVISLYIWTRGSLNTHSLHSKLAAAVHHAMCDAVTEHSLEMPFTPPNSVKTSAMKTLFEDSEKDDSRFLPSFFQSKFGSTSTSRLMAKKDVVGDEHINEGTSLNEFYASVLPDWLKYVIEISSPSVTFSSLECPGKLKTEQVVNNICKILTSILGDSHLLKFCKTLESTENWTYIKSNVDGALDPGKYLQFALISRNFDLWKKSVKSSGSSVIRLNPSLLSLQKFPPHDATLKPEASPCPQHDMMMSSSYISRQHLVYVITRNKSVQVFLYNVAHEKSHAILKRLEHCTKFHTARLNMLQGLTFQKMGLFKHYLTKPANSAQSITDLGQYSVDFLTRCNSLTHVEKNPRYSLVDKCFDEFLLNIPQSDNVGMPAKQSKDKTSLFGQQCFMRLKQKSRLREAQSQLKNLRRNSSGNLCTVTTSDLHTILSFARLHHTVTSPIMLDDLTRQTHVAFFEKPEFRHKDDKSEKVSSVLSRTSSFLGNYRRKSGESLSKIPDKDGHNLSKDRSNDFLEVSFDFMAKKFADLYADHWKGFVNLQASDLAKLSKQMECDENSEGTVHYRYRFMKGGIILIAFSVQRHCFEVKLYTITTSTFSDQSGVFALKTHSNFVDECEKVRRNLDVHRIALDVHLSYLQWYLNEIHSVVRIKCNLRDLLHSLVIAYTPLLDNIQSQIYHGTVSHTCTQVSCQDLYKFIVTNASAFKLKTCPIQKEKSDILESVLFTEEQADVHTNGCPSVVHNNCSFCQIIFKDGDHESNALKLHYYLLFSVNRGSGLPINQNKRVPESLMQVRADLSRRLSEASSSSSTGSFLPQIQKEIVKEDEVLEDLPDKNVRVPCHVLCEKRRVEENLQELAFTATMECFRSRNLWQKLVHVCQDKINAKALSFTEFSTLLKMMQSSSASDYDSKISQLFKKRNVKQDPFIIKRLLKNFPKMSTVVTSPDNEIQRVCILSCKNVHVMVIVKVNTRNCDLDLFVVKPLTEHLIFHEDSAEDACEELLQKVCNAIATSIWMSWF